MLQKAYITPVMAFVLSSFLTSQQESIEIQTEKLWHVKTAGIMGWGAASKAQRVSSALSKQKGIKDVVFDTTGEGYFRTKKKDLDPIELRSILVKALYKKRIGDVKITSLKQVDIAKPVECFELSIKGLGWSSSAHKTREVLSSIEDVIRVHPFGLNGKCLVYMQDKKALTKEKIDKALSNTDKLSLRKFKRVSVWKTIIGHE